MPLNRSPPTKAQTNILPAHLMHQSLDRSLSESHLNELNEYVMENTPTENITQRFKRRRNDDVLEDLNSFKDEIRSMIRSFMGTQQKELETITSNLKEIQETNHNIDSSIALLTTQNEEFRKKIDQLEVQAKKDSDRISLLEDRIEDMQRESRKTAIEIKNVPRKKDEIKEDLIDMVLSLSNHINCKIDKTDIRDIYRVNGKRNNVKNSPIVVEMGSTIVKTDVLKLCKLYNVKNSRHKLQAKHLGFTTHEDDPVFVSEQLTSKAARLFFLARDLTKSSKYKFCWTSFGRVYVRLNDTSPIIQIRKEEQIQQLHQKTDIA